MKTRSATARHPWLRFVAMLALAAGMASVGIAGCHDTLPVEPASLPAPEAALSTYPTEEQFAGMPVEFQTAPSILGYWVKAGFVGDQAYGSAWMQYFANYAKITLPVTLIRNNSEVTSTTGYTELASTLPMIREMNAFAAVGVSGTCGHTVNASGIFFVRHQFPMVTKGWFAWGEETETGTATKSQEPCSCTGTVSLRSTDYDPYSSSQGDGCDSSNSGSSGSGTQFRPGDYTGGETVSWSTGTGNGGTSLCGSDAMVDYVCIDYWDEATQRWIQWGCGYITTCGWYSI